MSDHPQKDPDAEYGDEPGIAHFQRPDNRYIDYEPSGKLLEVLPHMSEEELLGLGLQPWDEGRTIWLFPVEWYEHIPEGAEVYSAFREEWEPFSEETHAKEARYGAMPFGVRVDE